RRLVAAEPLRADPDPALQAGLGAGDARRDPLPRPGLQPVPDLRGAAPRRPRGDREGLRAAGPDGDEPLSPDRRAAARARDRRAAGDARRGDRRALAVGAGAQGARAAHLRPLRRDQAQGVGRVPRPADRVGARAVPESALTPAAAGAAACPLWTGAAPRSLN